MEDRHYMGRQTLIGFYINLLAEDRPFRLSLKRKAVSKERPRTGRGGHVYTPKRTREFEQYVADAARTLLRSPYTCQVYVDIEIVEPIPKSYKGAQREAAEQWLINPPVGDLDNKVKAITDGLNGIAYLDDRQINQLTATRRYGDEHSIEVTVQRSGLSRLEVEQYENGYDRHPERSPQVGKDGRASIPMWDEQGTDDRKRPSRRHNRS